MQIIDQALTTVRFTLQEDLELNRLAFNDGPTHHFDSYGVLDKLNIRFEERIIKSIDNMILRRAAHETQKFLPPKG